MATIAIYESMIIYPCYGYNVLLSLSLVPILFGLGNYKKLIRKESTA
ncbi:hypothetical protein OsI_38100 [Oryza sativa Indica Group]|uniref:Uncharacterized protein n=1 Tax=Oryza sativa subsp. indica TaxID=39946 RepID=B8BPA9_ORYSI|nr:hypothetical protein OsI_38100 [Oryza sativa Indica Group]